MVRDSHSGRFIEVRGANSMSSSQLPLKKGLDLTKPIAAQALEVDTDNPYRPTKKD